MWWNVYDNMVGSAPGWIPIHRRLGIVAFGLALESLRFGGG